jgi:hypothetical protein
MQNLAHDEHSLSYCSLLHRLQGSESGYYYHFYVGDKLLNTIYVYKHDRNH